MAKACRKNRAASNRIRLRGSAADHKIRALRARRRGPVNLMRPRQARGAALRCEGEANERGGEAAA